MENQQTMMTRLSGHLPVMLRSSLCLLLIAYAAASCVKDKPHSPEEPPVSAEQRRLYIACEGSFGNGNASLSIYNPDTDSLFNNVFGQKNGQGLGDVFQSMLLDSGRLFMAINNSDKIVVTSRADCALLGTISLPKPRYMLKISPEKMYVSSLYYPKINIVNPQTLQVTGSIGIDYPNSEGMTLLNGKVYACNWDTACSYLYEIDPGTDAITARIPLAGRAAQQVLVDKEQKLWVLAGNVYKQKVATLTQIDPVSKSILKSFTFPEGADVIKPCWNPGRDTLYFLGVNYNGGTAYNGVYRMDIHATALPGLFIQAQPLQYFWALAVDPVSRLIYVGDPKGFTQNGNISVYQTDGQKVRSFDVGLGPGYLLFEE